MDTTNSQRSCCRKRLRNARSHEIITLEEQRRRYVSPQIAPSSCLRAHQYLWVNYRCSKPLNKVCR
jgi:phosphodiesterase/alkaline phosphatase D-like protein